MSVDWFADPLAWTGFLRSHDFPLAIDDDLRVMSLLDELRDRNIKLPDAPTAARWLAPILCRNFDQQARLEALFSSFEETVGERPVPVTQPKPAIARALRSDRRRSQLTWLILAGICAVLVGAVTLGVYWSSTSPSQSIPPAPFTPGPDVTPREPDTTSWGDMLWFLRQIGIALLPLSLMILFIFVRSWRSAAILRGFAPPDVRRTAFGMQIADLPLFRRDELRTTFADLRRHRLIPGDGIDSAASISATIAAAGFITLVPARRPALPGHLLLVDVAGRADHMGAFADLLMARLLAENIEIERFDFQGDPQHLRAVGSSSSVGSISIELPALHARYPDHRLLLLSDAAAFRDSLGNEWHGLIGDLHLWEEVAVITPLPATLWGSSETALIRHGFAVTEATPRGLVSLVRQLREKMPHDRAMPRGDAFASLDRRLNTDPYLWLGDAAPPDTAMQALVGDLKTALGPEAFFWLSALAVFPMLHPKLTFALGAILADSDGQSLMTEDRLARLCRLPWLRRGRMPNWLRLALVRGLETRSKEADEARAAWAYLLQPARRAGHATVPVTVVRQVTPGLTELVSRLLLQKPEYREAILLSFMNRLRLPELAVELPAQLARVMRSRSWVDLGAVAVGVTLSALSILYSEAALLSLSAAAEVVRAYSAAASGTFGNVISQRWFLFTVALVTVLVRIISSLRKSRFPIWIADLAGIGLGILLLWRLPAFDSVVVTAVAGALIFFAANLAWAAVAPFNKRAWRARWRNRMLRMSRRPFYEFGQLLRRRGNNYFRSKKRRVSSTWIADGYFLARLWLVVFFIVPLLLMVTVSLSETEIAQPPFISIFDGGPWDIINRVSFANYSGLLSDSVYRQALLRSHEVALLSILAATAIAFPFAYCMVRASRNHQLILLVLIALSALTPEIIRIAALMTMFQREGLVNQALVGLGIITEPVSWLGSFITVVIGVFHYSLPLMILPIWARLARISHKSSSARSRLLRTSLWIKALREAWPGVLVGAAFCYSRIAGEVAIPDLLGSSDSATIGQVMTIGQVIWLEFFGNRDWPVASAITALLVGLLLLPLVAYPQVRPPSYIQVNAPYRRTLSLRYGLVLATGLIVLYLPIAILIATSFNDSRLVTQFGGWSLRWYRILLQDAAMLDAASVTLGIALISATAATMLSTLTVAAVAGHLRREQRMFFPRTIYCVLMLPQLAIGLALLLLFVTIRFERGLWTIILSHTTVAMCLAMVIIQVGVARILRGSRIKIMQFLVHPVVLRAVGAAWLVVFLVSVGDLVTASFVTGPGATTLPIRIYSEMRLGIKPEINAVCTLIFAAVAVGAIGAISLLARILGVRGASRISLP